MTLIQIITQMKQVDCNGCKWFARENCESGNPICAGNAEELILLLKSHGYVRLADDQKLTENPFQGDD